MKKTRNKMNNENGSALVVALLILVVVLMLGTFATEDTHNELQIAGADLQFKKAFYEADGGTEVGSQLLEENIACYGFDPTETYPWDNPDTKIRINDADFWTNETVGQTAFFYPNDSADPITNIEIINEGTTFGIGGAVQMTSGYEGKGKGEAGGGAKMTFEVTSIRQKDNRTASTVVIEWRHVIGSELDCRDIYR